MVVKHHGAEEDVIKSEAEEHTGGEE